MYLYFQACDHSWISNDLEESCQNELWMLCVQNQHADIAGPNVSIMIRHTSFPPDQERFQSPREKSSKPFKLQI